MKKRLNLFLFALLVFLLALSCGGGDDDSGSSTTGDTSDPVEFTHKMMKRTGENLFAALAYECQQCTFEQWLAIVPPAGWIKGPAQVILFSSGVLRSTPSFDGVPDTMDFIEEIPGNEYQLIAKNLDGRFIGGFGNPIVEAQVKRDTLLRFDAGRRVHELTDPDGNVFVLFAYEVDPHDVVVPDFQDPEVLGDFTPPDGWSYASRVLEEELLLDTPDTATVLAIRSETTSTWEMR